MGTQRRIRNCDELLILPAGEVLPHHSADSAEKAAAQLEAAAKKLLRKTGTEQLRQMLLSDAEALRQGTIIAGERYIAAVYEEKTCALDYLDTGTLVCVSESSRFSDALQGWLWQLKQDISTAVENGWAAGALADPALSEEELTEKLAAFPLFQLESLPTSRFLLKPSLLLHLNAKQLSGYGGSLETACADMVHYLTSGYRVVVLCGGKVRAENLQELLRQKKIGAALDFSGEIMPEKGQVVITLGALSAGSEYPSLKLAVLTEGQLTQVSSGKMAGRRSADSSRQKLQSCADLSPGDLVVHTHHGIGRFVGMIRMPVDGVEKDYIKISYAGSDCLYVPATSLDLVSKYIGGGEDTERTKLHKLGGTEWARTTYKAKAAAQHLAKELIQLYAQRQRLAGFAFSPDSPWQQEFEDDFDYTETDDQLRAIAEIKADMEKRVPMDRLLCGDVGGSGAARRNAVHYGRQTGRHPCAHHRFGAAALRHRYEPLPQLPCDHRGAQPFPQRKTGFRYFATHPRGTGGSVDRHPQAAAEKCGVQGSGSADHRRGAALRCETQGGSAPAGAAGGHVDSVRHTHPPHAEYGAVRHPRYERHRRAAPEPAERADLCDGTRVAAADRGNAPRACPRRTGLLSAQPRG